MYEISSVFNSDFKSLSTADELHSTVNISIRTEAENPVDGKPHIPRWRKTNTSENEDSFYVLWNQLQVKKQGSCQLYQWIKLVTYE